MEIRINNVGIEETGSYRFLGVMFNGDLSFSEHCSGIAQKVRKRARVLRALAGTTWGACTDTLLRFYRSFVDPASTYGLVSLGVCAKDTHINKIEIARNEGLRTATGLPKSCKILILRNLTVKENCLTSHSSLRRPSFETQTHPLRNCIGELCAVSCVLCCHTSGSWDEFLGEERSFSY